ncbi:MAG: hypothetical protein PHP57_01530 [Sideroxydans sp.]|nr:hypothetical protein [Sideroxydans sp.]
MKHRDCPACGDTVPNSGLRTEIAPPRRLTSSWPRFFCPHCGVELRSSGRSLRPSLAFFVVGLTLLLGSGHVPENIRGLAQLFGSVAIAACLICVYWFHRWEVVDDGSA